MTNDKKTVIIADDHETMIMYLSILMRRMGFTVIPARNGGEVLKSLESFLPDLVITDRKMPIVDGFTTLKMMKSNPLFSDIPVIMISAIFEQEYADKCRDLGGVGFLTKPINIDDLHRLLQECMVYSNNKQRKNLRVSYNRKVVIQHEGQEQKYYAVTLSEQGVYLRTQSPLPVGTKIKVKLHLQDGHFLTTQGTVIYQKNISHDINRLDPGMAVKFSGYSNQFSEALKLHIMDLLAGDLVEEQKEPVISTEGVQKGLLQEKLSELKEEFRTH